MKLTDKQIQAAQPREKNYKLSDGNGLSLLVKPNGFKYFIYRFTLKKKQHELHLGGYPEISLKNARRQRDVCKVKVAEGVNPAEEKKKSKAEIDQPVNTFASLYPQWLESKKADWTPAYFDDLTS